MTPPSSSIDRQAFLENLRRSGLVSEKEVAFLASLRPELRSGKKFARHLIDEQVLTRYQAERLLAGRTSGFFLGQYRLLDLLGQGGMGRVYKAEHRSMKRIVALKVLANRVLQDQRAVQLFLHEVRAVAVLQHPNIVGAFDANEANGRHYLVLEYVDGPNLEQLVRRQGPLPVGLACDYVRQAALGLQFAHELGMIHRDVKPANMLVQNRGGKGERGIVKLSDFGLARLAASSHLCSGNGAETILTRSNSVMGTPDYLSPEQARDMHKTDIRGDVYSLGCSLYYLLSGSVPYPGGSAMNKLIRHSTETPRSLREFRDDVPELLVAVLDRMMAKNPNDRFATPRQVAEALQPLAVGGPTPWAVPVTPGELKAVRSDAELPALVDTNSVPFADTPHVFGPTHLPLRSRANDARPIALAVAIAVVFACSVLGLLALLALVSGR